MAIGSKIDKVVARIGDLPAMPDILAKVMEITEDPGVAVSDVISLIEQDPSLTAKLLKVSNSSYYGMRQVVGTLKLALVILGVKEVRNIVLGISVLDTLRDATTDRLLNGEGLWKHSTQVASLSKKLGTHLELSLQGEDFIAGLLHDIGKLVLWKQIQDDYIEVYNHAKENELVLHELEYEELGFDHADAASAVAVSWGLPESLSDALYAHHARADRPLSDSKDPKLSAVIRVANLAAKDDFAAEDAVPESMLSCNEAEAWDILSDSYSEESIEERFLLLKTFVQEVRRSPVLSL
ncbi:MAG TPA: HDOD domain-containing protein [Candidatus Hydrogenedentes bacterium]|nr:HDOD domain-containing protein [Candidatus Hydrogenedentota bacterium]